MKILIVLLLILCQTAFGQYRGYGSRTTTTSGNGAPDYIYMSNFISAVGLDTTTWASIGADIYGNNPSGKFTTYAPFVLPTFFDSTSYMVSVTTSQIVIYAGAVNTRWDIAVWDIDDRDPITYNDESLAIFARMTTQPNATRKQLISDFIDSLKTKASVDLWANADLIYDFAAQDSQASKLCWKNAAYNAVGYASPTWTNESGVIGNGSSSYVRTNFVPSTDGVKYTANAASYGIYFRTNLSSAYFGNGGNGSSNNKLRLQPWSNVNQRWGDVNESTAGATPASATSLGWFFMSRTSSSAKFIQWKTTQTDANSNVVGMPNVQLYVAGAQNNNGTADSFSARMVSFFYVGGTISKADALILNRIVEWYHDQKGIGVQ